MGQQEVDYMFTNFTVHKLVWQVLVWDEVLWPNRKYAMVASEGRLIGSHILTQEALGQLRLPWIKVEERGQNLQTFLHVKMFQTISNFLGKGAACSKSCLNRPQKTPLLPLYKRTAQNGQSKSHCILI